MHIRMWERGWEREVNVRGEKRKRQSRWRITQKEGNDGRGKQTEKRG
jgi:hypothetical protein